MTLVLSDYLLSEADFPIYLHLKNI